MTNIEKWLIDNGFKRKKCPSFLEELKMNEYMNKYGSSVFVNLKEKEYHVYESMSDTTVYGCRLLKSAIDDIPDKWSQVIYESTANSYDGYLSCLLFGKSSSNESNGYACEYMGNANSLFDKNFQSICITKPSPILAIYPNKEKRVCAVKFKDGSVSVLKLAKGEKWDLHTAIAYAIAQKVIGGKTAFAKYADSLIEEADGRKKVK